MLTINTKIERLPSVGPSLRNTLNKLGIFYIEDLFYHLPFRYIDFSQKIPIGQSQIGQLATLEGQLTKITARRSFRSRLAFTEAFLSDDTGQIKLVWFNQPYLAKQFHEGDHLIAAGKVETYKDKQLTNPYFEILQADQAAVGKVLPIYHLTSGITNLRLVKLIKLAWEQTATKFTDLLPDSVRKRFSLLPLEQAIQSLHFPLSSEDVHRARFRIAIDDVLPQQLAAQIKQLSLEHSAAPSIPTNVEFIKSVLKDLPFTLTPSQKRATWDILQDLSIDQPMNRLLEGDVGSGKTIVALLAAASVAKAGFQTVLLAPTEILARQHFETFQKFSGKLQNQIGLLTRGFALHGTQSVSKTELAAGISSGEMNILIGTHAVLSEQLPLNKLGLIIIDEQHRFGVGQRAFLGKQHNKDTNPHLLSMSATPIPRTLALSLFGNLAISQLKTLPAGRQPITSQLLTENKRAVAYQKITEEIAAGRQAFVITPKVEDSETGTKSVKAEFGRLQKMFPKFKLGLIYGGMKSGDKDEVMAQFANNELQILVATTVIEIGIDIPNATVMLIEGAENFGLAQLHQLRGRVGRGTQPSYCYLFTTDDAHLDTERLKIFEKTNDGFALAEFDLEQRGFGDLFGEQQSGFHFRFPKFITLEALKTAREIALAILAADPELNKQPILKQQASAYLETIHSE